ncbi:hypothetical protein WN51_01841 [Melipona quadrifasciata]|uniref:Uncharacterized protein n=1 Tax=Melipona quadrifasciata TaxID=166423 RepID=A0A0N1ITF4_9HYME|nr:hypothetical protein WN51_01841 [Melipona quadrifasciata]
MDCEKTLSQDLVDHSRQKVSRLHKSHFHFRLRDTKNSDETLFEDLRIREACECQQNFTCGTSNGERLLFAIHQAARQPRSSRGVGSTFRSPSTIRSDQNHLFFVDILRGRSPAERSITMGKIDRPVPNSQVANNFRHKFHSYSTQHSGSDSFLAFDERPIYCCSTIISSQHSNITATILLYPSGRRLSKHFALTADEIDEIDEIGEATEIIETHTSALPDRVLVSLH